MITLRKSKLTEEYLSSLNLNERQGKIIEYLREHRKITTAICAEFLNVSNDTALRELSRLKSLNLIDKKGIGRATYYILK